MTRAEPPKSPFGRSPSTRRATRTGTSGRHTVSPYVSLSPAGRSDTFSPASTSGRRSDHDGSAKGVPRRCPNHAVVPDLDLRGDRRERQHGRRDAEHLADRRGSRTSCARSTSRDDLRSRAAWRPRGRRRRATSAATSPSRRDLRAPTRRRCAGRCRTTRRPASRRRPRRPSMPTAGARRRRSRPRGSLPATSAARAWPSESASSAEGVSVFTRVARLGDLLQRDQRRGRDQQGPDAGARRRATRGAPRAIQAHSPIARSGSAVMR